MPKQKATTLSYMDQVLVWPSGHVSLAIGCGALMLQVITGVNISPWGMATRDYIAISIPSFM